MSDEQEFGSQNDLAIELDLTDVKEIGELESRGVKPGKYHAQITKVQRAEVGGKPVLRLIMRTKTATSPGMVNKTITENLFLSDAAKKRLGLIAKRLGLISESDAGKKVAPDWLRVDGKHVVVEMVEEEYTDSKGKSGKNCRMAYGGIWPVGHKDVLDVPIDVASMVDDGVTPPPGIKPAGAEAEAPAAPPGVNPALDDV